MASISDEEIDGRMNAIVAQRDVAEHQVVFLSGRVAHLEAQLKASQQQVKNLMNPPPPPAETPLPDPPVDPPALNGAAAP